MMIPETFQLLVDECLWLEQLIKDAKTALQEKAATLISECNHEGQWVWCDYLPGMDGFSLSPAMKCKRCRREYHGWNGLHGEGPGPKISREDLYKMRWPTHVVGEVPKG